MRHILLFGLLVLSAIARAQAPYQCLLQGQKQYFGNDRQYLRGMRIDSVRTVGSATVFYPFRTRRVRNSFKVDSAGGSWLGKEARVFAGGRTEFQNYWNDTVVIETLADTGRSWIFYSDTSSLYYVARVLAIDSAIINGQHDSVKTIGITAMRNGAIVTSPINSYRIRLSRNHGFREIFDLYTFPYTMPGGQIIAPGFDYFLGLNSYLQPAAYIFRPVEYRNPLLSELYDFRPGDVFNRSLTRQEVVVNGYTTVTTIQDSIKNRTLVSSGIQYDCVTRTYSSTRFDDPNRQPTESRSGPSNRSLFYPDMTLAVLDTAIMPEEGLKTFVYYYAPADSSRCLRSAIYRRVGYRFPTPLDAPPLESVSYKAGLGLTDSTGGILYSAGLYSYIRKGLSSYKAGSTCDPLAPLGVAGTVPTATPRVYPNPASNEVSVELTAGSAAIVTLTDITGRPLKTAVLSNGRAKISLTAIPAGLYVIRITDGNASYMQRLLIVQ